MPLHKNLPGAELHYPLGRYSVGALLLEDDNGNAYQIALGTDTLFNISTVNGSETVSFGNTSFNPAFSVVGTGLMTTGGGHSYSVSSLTGAGGTHDLDSSAHVILIDTSAAGTTLNLSAPSVNSGRAFLIVDKAGTFSSNSVILNRDASEKIDGTASNKTLNQDNIRFWLLCDGTDWYTFLDGESQSGGASGGAPYVDTTAIVKGSADATKKLKFEVDGIATSTTRTITMANQDVDLTPGEGVIWLTETASGTVSVTGKNKMVICDTSGGVCTITLPACATAGDGARFVIKDNGNASSNSLTVEGDGAETIDGEASKVIISDYGSIKVFTDGSNWYVE